MVRRGLVAVGLGLALVGAALAGIPTNRFTIDTGKDRGTQYLLVRQGRLALGASTFGKVYDTKDAADRWYVLGTQIKSSVGGGYLAYDASGKDRGVFLAGRPGDGTEWTVAAPGRAREGARASLRAASGPLKGWYLDVEEVEEEGEGGKKETVRRLVLSRKPSRELQVERIWEHK
jgi:hypothetical protein